MRYSRRVGLALAVALAVASLVRFPLPAGAAPVTGPPTPVGTWQITYGAPALVKIESTGPDEYSMTAASPVTVVGASCQLPVGTTIATMTASGTGYTGQHGLWDTTNCAFVRFTDMSLTVDGDRAVEKLGNGETRSLVRVTSATADSDHARSLWWLWLVLLALILAIVWWFLWRRRRRRRNRGDRVRENAL